jgi:hypothetical protein
MRYLAVLLLTLAALPAAQGSQTFTGVITDDMCAVRGHAAMRMGPTDAECTRACVDQHGAGFVLQDRNSIYALSDQKTPEKLAGQRVTVTGTLDPKTKTIRVESMVAAKP